MLRSQTGMRSQRALYGQNGCAGRDEAVQDDAHRQRDAQQCVAVLGVNARAPGMALPDWRRSQRPARAQATNMVMTVAWTTQDGWG